MEKLLTCIGPSCSTLYLDPRSLDCDHILCFTCLEKLYKPGRSSYIVCPLCEKQTLILDSISSDLPTIPCIEQVIKHFNEQELPIPMPRSGASVAKTTTTTTTNTGGKIISPPLNSTDQHNSPSTSQGSPSKFSLAGLSNLGRKASFSLLSPRSPRGKEKESPLRNSNTSGVNSTTASASPPTTTTTNTGKTLSPPIKATVTKVPIKSTIKLSTSPLSTSPVLQAKVVKLQPKLEDLMVSIIKCPSHSEPLKLFCENCDSLVCLECILSHNGHQFIKPPIEMEKRFSEVESLFDAISMYPNKLLKQKQSIEQRYNESFTQYKDTKNKIKCDIDQMIKNLQERRDTLEMQMDKEWNLQKATMEDQIGKITSSINEIQSSHPLNQYLMERHTSGQSGDSEKVSACLLKKYADLKKVEDTSIDLCNQVITTVEWRWESEFQFPQLFTTGRNGQPTTVIYRSKRNGSSNSNQSVMTTPPLNGSNNTPPMTPDGNINHTTNTPNASKQLSSTLSCSVLNLSGGMPQINIQSNPLTRQNSVYITIPSSPPASNSTSPSLSYQNGKSSPNGTFIDTSASSSPQKIQLKNPIYGKLLTRKDSTVTQRKSFIYGFNPTGGIDIFDPSQNRWRNSTASMINKTSEFSCVFDNVNFIYRFGGKESLNEIHKYSLDKDSWQKLDITIPTPRYAHYALYDGLKNIYLIGGKSADGLNSKVLERYDIISKSWSDLKPMNHARSNFHAFYHPNKKCIYVVDGYVSKERKSTVEMYSIDHNKWTVIGEIKQSRYFASVSFDGSRYINVMGGVDRATLKDISSMERFDTQNNTWETVTNPSPLSILTSSSSSSLVKSSSTSSLSSQSSSTSNGTTPTKQNNSLLSIEKIQFFNTTLFDGEQYIYYFGINIDEVCPLLYRYSLRSKKFERLSTYKSHLDLFSQLILVLK
ncbi:hypothetical protein CYY_006924 [Polysphondylium violaceum]|uniref:RING zinc finger-containing protein n=1 Tax=Polysphondylium violaceum TaxID=133409 RepID=A0A8J4UYD1_9MYCE|nr:hypothetical protein CYY_006924 [Polysphondylium violaceum]